LRTRRFTTALALLLALALPACEGPPREAPEPPAVAPAAPSGEAPAPAPRTALWVLCEGSQQVLEHPDRVPRLLEDARALGATDLFVQVYRGGRAWFDSGFADAGPWRSAVETWQRDPLASLIADAHAAGLRVHAWANVLSLAGNRDAPILRDLGREAAHVDRRGRSILDYPDLEVPQPERATVRMGTPAVWLDPAAPGVAERIVDTLAELVARYPELDGLHLDYIRYPDVLPFTPGSRFEVGVEFGYGEASRARFEAETGLRAPGDGIRGDADAWDQWRRDQVTGLVARLRGALQAANPTAELSAAVSAYPGRAYLSLFQDWRGWLEAGLLDFAVAMLYTRDDHLFHEEVAAYTGGLAGERVWIGLGSWLFARTPGRALAQLERARRDARGVALFSWDSIADAPPLRAALAAPRPATTADEATPATPPPVTAGGD
jgi:uncharacterized lipoprotein YddW (UPF0748 family)